MELFVPQVGTTFVTLFFGPKAACPAGEVATVTGKVASEALTDSVGSIEKIELGTAPKEGTSWLANFPATSIPEVWLVTAGVGKIVTTELQLFAAQATLTGTALTLLAGPKFEPEPTAKWSPLP